MPINIAELSVACRPLLEVDGACLRFPGGAQICFNFPTIPADNGAAIRGLLAQVNTALAPLQPIFTILEALLAVIECVQGVPEAITQLDPSGLIECIPNLVAKLQALAGLIPQLSLIAFLDDLLGLIVGQLTAMRTDVTRLANRQGQILAAAAEQVGRPGLRTAVTCALSNFDVEIAMFNNTSEPLNTLIGVVVGLLSVIGVPFNSDASLGAITADSLAVIDDVLAPIDALIDVLTVARQAIPS